MPAPGPPRCSLQRLAPARWAVPPRVPARARCAPHLPRKQGHGVGRLPLGDVVGVLLHLQQLLVQEAGAVVDHLHRPLGLRGHSTRSAGALTRLQALRAAGPLPARTALGAWAPLVPPPALPPPRTWQPGLGHCAGSLTLPRSFHSTCSAWHCMQRKSARLRRRGAGGRGGAGGDGRVGGGGSGCLGARVPLRCPLQAWTLHAKVQMPTSGPG